LKQIWLRDDEPLVNFIQQLCFHVLTGFIIAPFILRLPKGKSSFRKYLENIGLTRLKPFFRLVLLGLSCALILALSQAAASLVYRLFEGNPVNGRFLREVFNFSSLHPSRTLDLLLTLPSVFEWVLGQLVWSFILGLFYGYVFVRTKSLWPSMIIHYLSNLTISILSGYVIGRASVPMEILYQIVFSFGILPTVLMILWTRYFSKRWLEVKT